ncbi:hypothetical protein [Actinomadura gamaensis]|uniref:DUF4158 domain-containing protein n=1 Tax=Actinomadura gamaensis TaxID=1763541 RepID=A0ABV9UCY2_9ACTN
MLFTPAEAEVEWPRGRTQDEHHLLALVVWLKSYQRLGYFPKVEDVPAAVAGHAVRDGRRDGCPAPDDRGGEGKPCEPPARPASPVAFVTPTWWALSPLRAARAWPGRPDALWCAACCQSLMAW